MMSVETIEEQIAALDNASFSRLRDWFIEFDQSRWDRQIEADSNAVKLDFLINAALVEHQAGKTRDLTRDEFCKPVPTALMLPVSLIHKKTCGRGNMSHPTEI